MVVNGEKDPHFWTDPDVVRSLLPGLRQVLCTLRPEACATYVAREGRLARELAALAAELDNDLAPLSGRCVLSAQPFFQYFLHRFGIREAGTIEPVPGQEPPPAHVAATIERARADDCFGILAQRRLPDTSAKLVHRETGLPIIYLDPIGNADDVSYADYLRRNADILLKTALRSP